MGRGVFLANAGCILRPGDYLFLAAERAHLQLLACEHGREGGGEEETEREKERERETREEKERERERESARERERDKKERERDRARERETRREWKPHWDSDRLSWSSPLPVLPFDVGTYLGGTLSLFSGWMDGCMKMIWVWKVLWIDLKSWPFVWRLWHLCDKYSISDANLNYMIVLGRNLTCIRGLCRLYLMQLWLAQLYPADANQRIAWGMQNLGRTRPFQKMTYSIPTQTWGTAKANWTWVWLLPT